MTRFEISEGDVWAGNLLKRHWHRVSGLTYGSSWKWDLRLDMSRCPDGTTIKLCGVAMVSPFRYNRVRTGGLGQLPSFTHGDSDRFLATKTGDSITLKTYSYRQGYGPGTDSALEKTPLTTFSEKVAEVSHGQRFTAEMYHAAAVAGNEDLEGTVFMVLDEYGNPIPDDLVIARRERNTTALKHRTFAHAKGYEQPHAPADIHIDVF